MLQHPSAFTDLSSLSLGFVMPKNDAKTDDIDGTNTSNIKPTSIRDIAGEEKISHDKDSKPTSIDNVGKQEEVSTVTDSKLTSSTNAGESFEAVSTSTLKDNSPMEEVSDEEFIIPERFTGSGRKKAVPFPVKLMKVLSCKKYKDIITWLPDGKSFVVLQPQAFSSEVIPLFFKEGKYASFRRKLHRWGFQRIWVGEGQAGDGAFCHKNFQRNRLDLAEKIVCSKRSKPITTPPKTAPRKGSSVSQQPADQITVSRQAMERFQQQLLQQQQQQHHPRMRHEVQPPVARLPHAAAVDLRNPAVNASASSRAAQSHSISDAQAASRHAPVHREEIEPIDIFPGQQAISLQSSQTSNLGPSVVSATQQHERIRREPMDNYYTPLNAAASLSHQSIQRQSPPVSSTRPSVANSAIQSTARRRPSFRHEETATYDVPPFASARSRQELLRSQYMSTIDDHSAARSIHASSEHQRRERMGSYDAPPHAHSNEGSATATATAASRSSIYAQLPERQRVLREEMETFDSAIEMEVQRRLQQKIQESTVSRQSLAASFDPIGDLDPTGDLRRSNSASALATAAGYSRRLAGQQQGHLPPSSSSRPLLNPGLTSLAARTVALSRTLSNMSGEAPLGSTSTATTRRRSNEVSVVELKENEEYQSNDPSTGDGLPDTNIESAKTA